MTLVSFTLNNQEQTVDTDPKMPLLWVLRDMLRLTGTKYSCGTGLCGTCTVLIEGEPVRSCVQPIAEVANKNIITIEGLSIDQSHPVQKAWLTEDVSQCGYCQPGQILSAVALLNHNPDPSDEEIDAWMAGVLCRCGTYQRIKQAIHWAMEAG